MVERWWMEKFSLPPNHPLFRGQTLPDLLELFLADRIHLRGHLIAQLEVMESPTARSKLMDQVTAIDQALGEVEEGASGDPLADLWEAQMEAGIEPDLDLTLDDLKRK